jgi:putative transposase
MTSLGASERARIPAVLNSDRFVDATPVEVYATLLSEGVYLGLGGHLLPGPA